MTEASMPVDAGADVDPKTLRKAITGSAVGNATEWYDYGVYAYVAIEIADNFFPNSGLVGTFLVFAVSFVLRPLGGIFWGPLGDRIGRQRVLAMTILLMAAATFLVGVLPTYDQVGYWAIVFLVALRIVQGFSTGGEYGGAATFMAEYAPDKKRGFLGSFLEFGTIAGFTLAIGIVFLTESIIGPEAMTEWGWRVPFLIGGPIGLIGLYVRLKLEDTPVFRELDDQGHVESSATGAVRDLIANFWPTILTLIGIVAALNVANYTLLAYMPTYLTETSGFESSDADLLVIFGQVAMLVFLPIAGAMSDRVGRKPMWAGSFIGLIVLSVPMFLLIAQGFWPAVIGFAVLGVVYVAQLATISATFPAMFPSQVRFGGMAIGYNISTALFGGTALYVNDGLIKLFDNDLMPAYYMMAASVVGLISLKFVIETAGCSVRGTQIPGTPESEAEIAEMIAAGQGSAER